MSAIVRGLLHMLVAIGLGIGAGVGVVTWLVDHRNDQVAAFESEPTPEPRVGDRLEEAIAAVREDGVYVAPDGRYLLDQEGERAVERAVAASDELVYVIVWSEGGETGSDDSFLEDQLLAALGPAEGVVFVWEGPEAGDVVLLDDELRAYLPEFSTEYEFLGDPAVTLPRAVASVADADWYAPSEDESDYWGGTGGGIAAGALFATGILLTLLSVGWILSRMAGQRHVLPGRWRWREDTP